MQNHGNISRASGVFRRALGDAPLPGTSYFYEQSTDTVHGRLVRGLQSVASALTLNSAPECIRTRHFHSKNWKSFWGRGCHPGASTLVPSALNPCPLYKILNTPLARAGEKDRQGMHADILELRI